MDRLRGQGSAVIFDLDGTLVESLPSIQRASNLMLERYGLAPYTLEEVRSYIGHGSRYLVDKLLTGRHSELDIDEVLVQYLSIYMENCLYELRIFPGVLALCEYLKQQGFLLAVLTNKPHAMAEKIMAHSFPPKLFTAVLGQKKGAKTKPHPSTVATILYTLGVEGNKSYFVGDSAVDVHTARAGGLKSIAVLWGYRTRAELEEAQPDYLVASAEELRQVICQDCP